MTQTLAQLATLLLLVQAATSHAAPLGSDNTKLDITDKTTSQGPLRLDLHYPAAPKAGAKFPLVIFTDGGGWVTGDKTIGDRGVRFRGVSPVNYLLANSPPLLMIQGDKDTTIPVHHARHMKERAEAVKAPVEIFIVQNSGHNWREEGGALRPSLDEIVAKTAAFMKQTLALQK